MESLEGQLLVASPQLMDPNFARALVLLIQHSHRLFSLPHEISQEDIEYGGYPSQIHDEKGNLSQRGDSGDLWCEFPIEDA